MYLACSCSLSFDRRPILFNLSRLSKVQLRTVARGHPSRCEGRRRPGGPRRDREYSEDRSGDRFAQLAAGEVRLRGKNHLEGRGPRGLIRMVRVESQIPKEES